MKLNPEFQSKVIENIKKKWAEISGTLDCYPQSFSFSYPLERGATSGGYILEVNDSHGKTHSLFIKKYGTQNSDEFFWRDFTKRDYEITSHISNLLDCANGFHVDKPYLILPDENALIIPFVVGQNLNSYFIKKLRFLAITRKTLLSLRNIVCTIGKSLTNMQAIPVDTFNEVMTLSSHDDLCSNYLTNLDNYARFLKQRGLSPDLVESARKIVSEILAQYFNFMPLRCFQHSDFTLQNFMIDKEDNLHLFDFPNAMIGVPYSDAAHFVNSLEDLSYLRTVSKKIISNLVHLFLDVSGFLYSFDQRVFSAFQIYYQFYSTKIILSVGRRNNFNLIDFIALESPKKRFIKNVKSILGQLKN